MLIPLKSIVFLSYHNLYLCRDDSYRMVSGKQIYIYSADGSVNIAELSCSITIQDERLQTVEIESEVWETAEIDIQETNIITVRTATDQYVSGTVSSVDVEASQAEHIVQICCDTVDTGNIRPVPFTQKSLSL